VSEPLHYDPVIEGFKPLNFDPSNVRSRSWEPLWPSAFQYFTTRSLYPLDLKAYQTSNLRHSQVEQLLKYREEQHVGEGKAPLTVVVEGVILTEAQVDAAAEALKAKREAAKKRPAELCHGSVRSYIGSKALLLDKEQVRMALDASDLVGSDMIALRSDASLNHDRSVDSWFDSKFEYFTVLAAGK
jgi:hypothetical protein